MQLHDDDFRHRFVLLTCGIEQLAEFRVARKQRQLLEHTCLELRRAEQVQVIDRSDLEVFSRAGVAVHAQGCREVFRENLRRFAVHELQRQALLWRGLPDREGLPVDFQHDVGIQAQFHLGRFQPDQNLVAGGNGRLQIPCLSQFSLDVHVAGIVQVEQFKKERVTRTREVWRGRIVFGDGFIHVAMVDQLAFVVAVQDMCGGCHWLDLLWVWGGQSGQAWGTHDATCIGPPHACVVLVGFTRP
ncbi:hypothetical protein D3C80_1235480 [compost metagenome]